MKNDIAAHQKQTTLQKTVYTNTHANINSRKRRRYVQPTETFYNEVQDEMRKCFNSDLNAVTEDNDFSDILNQFHNY